MGRKLAQTVHSTCTGFLIRIDLCQSDIKRMKKIARTKKIALVEGHPLMRLGWHTLLNRLADDYEVVSSDIRDVEKLANISCPPDLAVLSLPADPYESHEAVAIAQYFLQPRRMLLLSEQSASWTPEDGAWCTSVYACIEKKACMDTIMAAVLFGMRDATEHCERMNACPGEDTRPPARTATDPSSEYDATHSNPVVDANREQSHGVNSMETPGQLTGTFASRTTSPLGHDSKAYIGDDSRLRLTPRQRDVLALLARGLPIKTVARMLDISPSTAKGHTASLYRQLKVNSKDEAVYTAHKLGILLNHDQA